MPESGPSADPNLESRREGAASLILDDEHLRGDLTDDEFKPLLDWALGVMDQVVLSTTGEDDDRADTAIGTARREIAEILRLAGLAVQAHRNGQGAGRREALVAIDRIVDERDTPNETGKDERRPLIQLASRLDAEPDLDTVMVATEIVQAIRGPTTRQDGGVRR